MKVGVWVFFRCGLVALLFVIGSGASVLAQGRRPPLATERPGVFFAAQVMPEGMAQLELGVEYLDYSIEGNGLAFQAHQWGTPFMIRYGLLENLELRFHGFGATRLDQELTRSAVGMTEKESQSGFSNPSLGIKWQLASQEDFSARPAVGILLTLDLPAGSESFRPDETELTSALLLDFPLPSEFGLNFNAAVSFRQDGSTGGCFTEGLGALALSRALSDQTSFFIEVAGGGPQSDGGEGYALVDGGFLFLVRPNLQLDFAVGRGITRYSTDWGLTFGVSFYLF